MSVATTDELAPGPLRRSGPVRNTLFQLAAQLAGAVFTAAETLFLVRALGSGSYGKFALVLSIGALIALPATFGLPLAVGRFVADHLRDADAIRAIVRRGLTLQVAAALLVLVVLFACAGPLAQLYGHRDLGWPIRWIALSLFGSTLVVFFLNNFTALRHSAANLRLAVWESASETAATITLVAVGLGIAGAALGRAIGYTVGAVAGAVLLVRFLGPWRDWRARRAPVTDRTLLGYAGALFVVDSAYTALNNVDVLLIGAVLTTGAVGQFGAVLRLLPMLGYLGQAVAGGVSPRLARGGGEVPDVRGFNLALRGLIVVQGLLLAPLLVWAHPIVTLLLGPGYHSSVGVLRVLAPAAFLGAFASVTSIGANYLGLAGRRVPIAVGTLLLAVVLTVVLLKTVGLLGAAIADDVVILVYVVAHLWICHRAITLDLAALGRTLARTLGAAAAMSIPLLIAGTGHLSPLAWIIGGLAGLATFAAALLASGELSGRQLRAVTTFVATRYPTVRGLTLPCPVRRSTLPESRPNGWARRHGPALLPGSIVVALLLAWAVHNGGYDADTWYWGSLLLLALVAGVVGLGVRRQRLGRSTVVALWAFGLYVAWCYLSIAWARSPGDALQGSNRALLYLLVFALMVLLPWTTKGALLALVTFVLGVGVIGIVLLIRLASGDHVGALVIEGRLAAPTGYFNSTAALFTIGALGGIALAARRELPAVVRGALIATACAGLQLALIVQSRGWLFTLPLIAIVAIAIVPDRLRVVGAAALPLIGALTPIGRLLDVFRQAHANGLADAAGRAGQAALLICAAMFIAGTLIARGEQLIGAAPVRPVIRRRIGVVLTVLAIAGVAVGGAAATHGHPIDFITRQWNGFSHAQKNFSTRSHFGDVGSGRYDYWRVSLDAFLANPVGGLGQDNFADYYVVHRHTTEEPAWTHSLEFRLLAHTGVIGFILFGLCLIVAARAAVVGIRRVGGLAGGLAAGALLPGVVWLIYGSVDWFWEMPALSGAAFAFLGLAVALGERGQRIVWRRDSRRRLRRRARVVAGGAVLALAVVALGVPYLSVREVSQATDIAVRNPQAALSELATAANLNPLSADPGRVAGTIALQSGLPAVAESRFQQAIAREPDGWFSWLGAGLAASALGDRTRAHHDFAVAARLNTHQPAIADALARVYGNHPLTLAEALHALVLTQ